MELHSRKFRMFQSLSRSLFLEIFGTTHMLLDLGLKRAADCSHQRLLCRLIMITVLPRVECTF